MRTIEYGAPTHVPAFLTKLWKLVTDESCDELISWSPAGSSFIIFDEIRFSKELLPMYFKHNNMASFVRQLNMYGFRKLSCIDQGGMHCYRNEIEFYHQYFIKGQESLLELIKRKIPSSKSEEPKVKHEYIEELKNNIKVLKSKQDHAEHGMKCLKRENKMLWRQVDILSEQYTKQQVVLQQLLPFFMNMVHHSNREIAMKRKAALMIDEGSMQSKLPRLSPPYYVEHSDQDTVASMPSSPGNVSNRGPVIHDVTELESSKMFPANILCSPNTSTKENEAIVDSPLSCSLESSERNSPYSDSAVETLNILNQKFERSSSISPHVELKHSSAAASSSLYPSQIRAMPSPQTSRYSISNGISPVTIIDETTSDVPLPGSLMASSFVPKVEDTADSGMYTMDGILNKRSPIMLKRSPVISEQSTSLLSEQPTTIMAGQLRPLLQTQSTSTMSEQARSFLQNPSASIVSEQMRSILKDQSVSEQARSILQNPSTSVTSEQTRSILQDQSAPEQTRSILQDPSSPIVSEPPRSMLRDQSAQLLPEQSATIGQATSLLQECLASVLPDRIATIKSDSTLNESAQPSTSSVNKFFPNSLFISKTFAGNPPWLLNQEPEGTAATLDSWLGDVFTSDNLTPGLSLPRKSEVYMKNE